MAARIAWVLNLDADLELAAGGSYSPKRSVTLAMRSFVPRLAASLLGEGDSLVDDTTPALAARGLVGRAFCPTRRALAILRRAGAEPEAHPSVDVLRRVNSRAFASALGTTLPQAAFITDLTAARAMLEGAPALGDAWRVKRAFGMTGRGQRIVPSGGRSLAEPDLAFVRAGLAEGGVQIEPNVAIVREYAIHGMLEQSGAVRVGAVVLQRCDARGAWLATEPLSPEEGEGVIGALAGEAERVAVALSKAGYFGPFGVDAYTYRDRDGALHLQPRSEINARYTMGFAVGMA